MYSWYRCQARFSCLGRIPSSRGPDPAARWGPVGRSHPAEAHEPTPAIFPTGPIICCRRGLIAGFYSSYGIPTGASPISLAAPAGGP